MTSRLLRHHRTALAFLSLAILVLLVRLIWGWWVSRQLTAQLDDARRRGHPISLSDLTYPTIPDSQNAWTLQTQAAAALVPGVASPRSSNFEFPDYPPFPPEWHKLAQASEQAHTQAFALARQARQLSRTLPRRKLTSPVLANQIMLLPYNDVKFLANTLADGAEFAHLHGDDIEAIDRVLDMLHIARSLRHDHFIISPLVAIGIDSMSCHAVQVMAHAFRLDAASTTTRPALRQKVRQLMDTLLDHELALQSMRPTMQLERVTTIDSYRFASRGTWLIRPLADQEILRVNFNLELMIKAAGCTTLPDAKAVLDLRHKEKLHNHTSIWFRTPPKPTVPRYSRWFQADIGDGSALAVMDRSFRAIAERRATAVSLACHLYRADHGRWPDQLNQLVPNYLSAVPSDPFHADGRPLGYMILKGKLPDGGDRPLIYYDAGETNWINREPMYGWSSDDRDDLPSHQKKTSTPRQYRDITRFLPLPSAKAVNDNP